MERFASEVCAAARELAPVPFRAWALDRIARELPFDSALFMSPRLAVSPATVNKDAYRHLYWRYARDPAPYRRGMERGDLAAVRDGAYLDTEVFSVAERERLQLYVDMVRPQGIRSQLVAHPRFHHQRVGVLYLCRHERVGAFRPRDRERLVRMLSPVSLALAALEPVGAAEPQLLERLTAREREVVALVARGLRNREIAAVLGSRPATVRNQLHAIFQKLEVTTRAELVAVQLG